MIPHVDMFGLLMKDMIGDGNCRSIVIVQMCCHSLNFSKILQKKSHQSSLCCGFCSIDILYLCIWKNNTVLLNRWPWEHTTSKCKSITKYTPHVIFRATLVTITESKQHSSLSFLVLQAIIQSSLDVPQSSLSSSIVFICCTMHDSCKQARSIHGIWLFVVRYNRLPTTFLYWALSAKSM